MRRSPLITDGRPVSMYTTHQALYHWVLLPVFVIAVLALLLTIVVLFDRPPFAWMASKEFKRAIGVFWAIAPPVWFFVEYYCLFRNFGPTGSVDFEHFKYTQDVAAKAWAGLVAVLGVYFIKESG